MFEPRAPSAPRDGRTTPPCRILLIDDYEPGATALAQVLRLSGHVVTTVFTAEGALDAALAFQPDLILLDIGLKSRTDGFAVAHRLRAERRLAGTLLVALSGRMLGPTGLGAGSFDAYLEKPAELAAIERVIAMALTPADGAKGQ